MEEKTLLFLAIITALAGMNILFIIYLTSEFPEVAFLENNFGRDVLISGEVVSVNSQGSITFLEVRRVVPVVYFNNISVEEGTRVTITGEVDEYNGNIQLVARTISFP